MSDYIRAQALRHKLQLVNIATGDLVHKVRQAQHRLVLFSGQHDTTRYKVAARRNYLLRLTIYAIRLELKARRCGISGEALNSERKKTR